MFNIISLEENAIKLHWGITPWIGELIRNQVRTPNAGKDVRELDDSYVNGRKRIQPLKKSFPKS